MKDKFSVITKEAQKDFEHATKGREDETPCICGYYGRGCRQMEKREGANRALCMTCPLAEYAKNLN